MNTVILKPAPDRNVRKPDGPHLAAEGEPVPKNTYWQRRLNEGDVKIVASPEPQQKDASK